MTSSARQDDRANAQPKTPATYGAGLQASPSTKGAGASADQVGRWNLLREDVSLPAAVVYQSRLENNLAWMQRFADSQQVKLAPHGKTTMTPAFFKQQVQAGAWGLTLATAPQVAAARLAGIKRILMANQLVGKRNMEIIRDLLALDEDNSNSPKVDDANTLDYYCLVDSVDNVHQLGRFFEGTGKSLQLLLEVGVEGGRCGCRDQQQIAGVIDAIQQHNCLKLRGIETYEGVIGGPEADQRIRQHLLRVRDICKQLMDDQAFDGNEVILTGAGSAWYDLVAQAFGDAAIKDSKANMHIVPVIRPGCYLVHDKGIYLDAQQKVMARLAGNCNISGDLESSLEIWAYVQSIPEANRAVLGLGKRDVAFDAGLPQPHLFYRPGSDKPVNAPSEWQVLSIMDQHSMMAFPAGTDLRVGDIIALSTSHPCLTFDKWRQLSVIDDDYNVIDRVETHF